MFKYSWFKAEVLPSFHSLPWSLINKFSIGFCQYLSLLCGNSRWGTRHIKWTRRTRRPFTGRTRYKSAYLTQCEQWVGVTNGRLRMDWGCVRWGRGTGADVSPKSKPLVWQLAHNQHAMHGSSTGFPVDVYKYRYVWREFRGRQA